MRRIVIALASTVTGLVLLFSWPTSLNKSVAADDTAAGGTGTSGGTTATGSDTTGSGSTSSGSTDSGSTSSGSTDSGSTSSGSTDSGSTSSGSTDSGSTSSGSTDSGTTTQQSSGTTTYTGAAARTRFGNVTVEITVTDGKLTDVQAIEYPNSNPRDQQINAYAIPILNEEAVAAGSAAIQTVSGATFTSQGYIASLQDALDQAGL